MCDYPCFVAIKRNVSNKQITYVTRLNLYLHTTLYTRQQCISTN